MNVALAILFWSTAVSVFPSGAQLGSQAPAVPYPPQIPDDPTREIEPFTPETPGEPSALAEEPPPADPRPEVDPDQERVTTPPPQRIV